MVAGTVVTDSRRKLAAFTSEVLPEPPAGLDDSYEQPEDVLAALKARRVGAVMTMVKYFGANALEILKSPRSD